MTMHVYEFEIYPDEGVFGVEPFELEGGTCGADFDEAVLMASDWLRAMMEGYDIHEIPLPRATFGHRPNHRGGKIVCIAVDAGRDTVRKVTASEAARRLGVTPGRVTQMLDANQLEGWREGRHTWVTIDSINARKAERPCSGRPSNATKPEMKAAEMAGGR